MLAAATQPSQLLERKQSDAGLLVKIGTQTSNNWYKIIERAEPFIKRIEDGSFVKASFATDTTISYIKEVDRDGNDVIRPKKQWNNGSRKADPQEHQRFLHLCMLKEARQFVTHAYEHEWSPEHTRAVWEDIMYFTSDGVEKLNANINKEVSKC